MFWRKQCLSVAKTFLFAWSTFKPFINRFANRVPLCVQKFKAIAHKNMLSEARNDVYDVLTSWSHCVAKLFFMNRCAQVVCMFVPTLRAIGPKTRPQWLKNNPKWQLWRHYVVTSLRCKTIFCIIRCAHVVCMFEPNFRAIGLKTRPQWPENHPKWRLWRHNVMTSLCHSMNISNLIIYYTQANMDLGLSTALKTLQQNW